MPSLATFSSSADLKNDFAAIDWWTDVDCINAYKLVIDKLVSRVNSINGRVYGQDPTILAWETASFSRFAITYLQCSRRQGAGWLTQPFGFQGNEMNVNGDGPAPASWTLTIAAHLKSRASQLVMDGSFARNEDPNICFPLAVLESPLVDLISYHYYGTGDISRLTNDVALAAKYGKVFVAGEYGFFDQATDYDSFLQAVAASGAGGSLCWSLRSHSSKGGFKVHGEGNGQWSYRSTPSVSLRFPLQLTIIYLFLQPSDAPGWSKPLSSEFDPREAAILSSIRTASYSINPGETLPALPVPSPPAEIWFKSPTIICWTGTPWAYAYVVVVRNGETGEERQKQVMDCVSAGTLSVDLTTEMSGWEQSKVKIRMRALSCGGMAGVDSTEYGT
ncbi:hypothetical protein P7C70_g4679, partial [Phenoliferia sp. Uapishka_3]